MAQLGGAPNLEREIVPTSTSPPPILTVTVGRRPAPIAMGMASWMPNLLDQTEFDCNLMPDSCDASGF